MHKCSSLSSLCLILVCNIIVVRTLQIDQAGRRTSGGQVGQGRERGQVRRGERGRGAVQGHAARRAGGENIGPPDADTAQGRAARIVPERRRDGHGRQHVFESESAQGADSDCRWRWRRRAMIIHVYLLYWEIYYSISLELIWRLLSSSVRLARI